MKLLCLSLIKLTIIVNIVAWADHLMQEKT